VPDEAKPPVFLLDAMSFIFRAYHAMQRSRPMSTRSGLPTAATYVFVNMIKKLRQDFSPRYFAAVFDVSGEVFRDERARAIGMLRKWNSKTKSFEDVSYEGYKAHREAMPEDLRRQIPYIRRSLEALRIPVLEAMGFEADDVIGTLAREAAEREHEVFIVSGDKDMMQLVTPRVKVLNPQKDNLILDAAKVVETLGVPPEKVVDVMALRGDSIDNIPGAPGIGDKGSVELIVQFGSVEAVLDRASEVKRKSYRESLEQNRDAVLLSKDLVTIDCHVPLELDLDAMTTLPPDVEACRELFTELEFTSMLRELEPSITAAPIQIIDKPNAEQIAAFYNAAHAHGFAFALDAAEPVEEQTDENAQQSLSLLDAIEEAEQNTLCNIGVCAERGVALQLPLTQELRALLQDASVPKRVHDLKLALHVLHGLNVALLRVKSHTFHANTRRRCGPSRPGTAFYAPCGGCGDRCADSFPAGGNSANRRGARVYRDRSPSGAGALSDGASGRAHRYQCPEWPLAAICDRVGAGGRADFRTRRTPIQHQLAQATWRGSLHAYGLAGSSGPWKR
jgi:DNA polymerase I